MAERETGVDTVELALRISEVGRKLAVDTTEIKGALALLVQGAEEDRRRADERHSLTREEIARIAAQHAADQVAQARKDEDQEKRLRAVERKVYIGLGAAIVLAGGSGLVDHLIR